MAILNKKILKTTLIVMGLCLLAALVYLYFYTHKPIEHIPSDPASTNKLTFFALGDQGSGKPEQWKVAASMEQVAEKKRDLDFVMLLGDNFYGGVPKTLDSSEWLSKFEHVYVGDYLDTVPFYAILGNHDQKAPDVQIEYARQHKGSNRWRMPDLYYSEDFGKSSAGTPLLRVVFIDTSLGEEDLRKQAQFISTQFERLPKPVWRMVVGHHPVRDHGAHEGDLPFMSSIILPALKAAQVDFYLCGHDHNQQVIAEQGEPFYFIAGGGGAELYEVKQGATDLLFSNEAHGFAGVQLDEHLLEIAQYNDDGVAQATYKLDRGCGYGKVSCLQYAR